MPSDRLHRLEAAAAALRDAVLGTAGTTPVDLRRAAFGDGPVPPPWQPFVHAEREHAYRIVDADVRALQDAGLTDDEIFEVTVAAALGAAQRRLDAGLRALGAP